MTSQPPVQQSIRAFVAIEIGDDAKRALSDAIAALRAERIAALRPVRPEGVHLTLKFLGDIAPEIAPRIGQALAEVAARHAPFTLTLGDAGFFPAGNAGRARVLWVGIDGDADALRQLQRDVDDALAALGFPRERHPFRPHLTLARLRHRASPPDRRRAAAALANHPLPQAVRSRADAVSLMQSELLPGGARYSRIAHAALPTNPLVARRCPRFV